MGNTQFDHIAQSYDEDFSNTLIGKAQRQLVWNILDKYYPNFNNVDVLELNCGTGLDASKMAEKGASVLATDISPEMVRVTSLRTKSFPKVSTQVLDITELAISERQFDLIFSNFGGLNCLSENELQIFMSRVGSLINSGGHLIMVVMPRNTIWEMLYFVAKGTPKKAFRRLRRQGVDVNLAGNNVKTFYYNPSTLVPLKGFHVESISPVGLFVPPSYLENRYTQKPKVIDQYYQKDKRKFDARWLAKFADHYCIVMKKE